MTTSPAALSTDARQLVDLCQETVDRALSHAAQVTEGGRTIDDHQVHTERLAYLATMVRAANEQTGYAERLGERGQNDTVAAECALIYAADVARELRSQLDSAWDDFGSGRVTSPGSMHRRSRGSSAPGRMRRGSVPSAPA